MWSYAADVAFKVVKRLGINIKAISFYNCIVFFSCLFSLILHDCNLNDLGNIKQSFSLVRAANSGFVRTNVYKFSSLHWVEKLQIFLQKEDLI